MKTTLVKTQLQKFTINCPPILDIAGTSHTRGARALLRARSISISKATTRQHLHCLFSRLLSVLSSHVCRVHRCKKKSYSSVYRTHTCKEAQRNQSQKRNQLNLVNVTRNPKTPSSHDCYEGITIFNFRNVNLTFGSCACASALSGPSSRLGGYHT